MVIQFSFGVQSNEFLGYNELMRIALVHDYLVQYGGAERVLECFCELFPEAPIYTLLYEEKLMHGALKGKDIRTSYLQKIPFSGTNHRVFPPLMPSAIESFNLDKYDVVLSDSSSFAKGVITGPGTLHICYMHTPMRFAWDDCQKYTQEFYFPRVIKRLVPFFMNYIRIWDRVSAERPDKIIANSNFIRRRIKKYYKRDSAVIHPPVSLDKFYITEKPDNYFLLVGRMMSYKKFDIVIRAFNKLKLPLKIIGRGPEYDSLRDIAENNVEFLGRVADEELFRCFSRCRAFIFPQEEDFGITAIEAMASGRPLIAYYGGDIPEHMSQGKAGVFFYEQTPEAVAQAVEKFNACSYDSYYLRNKAAEFDREIFKDKIKRYVEQEFLKHKKNF